MASVRGKALRPSAHKWRTLNAEFKEFYMNKNRIRLAVLAALMFGLCCAASAADGPRARSELFRAAERNDVAEAQRLIAEGVDVNARGRYDGDYNPTVLMVAAWNNSVDVAKLLIAAGADVNAWDNKVGETALICAARKTYVLEADSERNKSKNMAMVKLLIEAGANVNDKDGYGRTALIYAAKKNSVDLVKILIEAGADVNVKDGYGNTALYYALKSDVKELLRAAGAR